MLYSLSYNNEGYLVQTPELIHTNLKKYLDQYRIISDGIHLKGGYIVNFGVMFDVVAHKTANKSDKAVNTCSPPDNKLRFCNFFPGGLAKISKPACNGSLSSVNFKYAFPPPKS